MILGENNAAIAFFSLGFVSSNSHYETNFGVSSAKGTCKYQNRFFEPAVDGLSKNQFL